MNAIVARGLYPTVLTAALIVSWLVASTGAAAILHTGAVVVGFALLIGVFERIWPHSASWRPAGRSMALDIVHSLFSAALAVPIVRAIMLTTVVVLGAKISEAIGSPLWPSHWPLAFQVVLGVLAADFGAYWAHRAMHATETGWRIHALHHSPEGLNFLAAGRTHPFNAFFTVGAEHAIVLLMGITPEALALLAVFKGVNGLLQHSNVALRPGWLSHLLATSEVHRWHHSRVLAESNTNFGNATMVWDKVFGTFFLPADRRPSEHVGIEETHIPERYLDHLASPFILPRFSEPKDNPSDGLP